jgi:hypothetical protein
MIQQALSGFAQTPPQRVAHGFDQSHELAVKRQGAGPGLSSTPTANHSYYRGSSAFSSTSTSSTPTSMTPGIDRFVAILNNLLIFFTFTDKKFRTNANFQASSSASTGMRSRSLGKPKLDQTYFDADEWSDDSQHVPEVWEQLPTSSSSSSANSTRPSKRVKLGYQKVAGNPQTQITFTEVMPISSYFDQHILLIKFIFMQMHI